MEWVSPFITAGILREAQIKLNAALHTHTHTHTYTHTLANAQVIKISAQHTTPVCFMSSAVISDITRCDVYLT
jgi:hypothetical protein